MSLEFFLSSTPPQKKCIMEKYNNIENDTFDETGASGAPDVTSATIKSLPKGLEYQAQQKRQFDAEIITKRPEKLETLRTTCENRPIRFKVGEPHQDRG